MSQGANTPPQAYTRRPTKQEAADCPYLFEQLEAVYYQEDPSDITYYAKWHGQKTSGAKISKVRGATRPATRKL